MVDNEKVRLIAFYLPQFHPIPENDQWWGKGFTEWRNVVKGRSLFPGHYQPHLPADLGFYDLRVPEVREAQADLAREYGIYGFCYYHYWFNGRRLLERPFEEVLASGKPDFPFCLCWANENWTRAWDGGDDQILLAQDYNDEDDLAHITSLIPAFRDKRYIKVNGKPVFLVYRTTSLPDPFKTANIWREAAGRCGIGDLYLIRVESFGEHIDPRSIGFDAGVEFAPHCEWVKPKYGKIHNRFLSQAGIISRAYLENRIFEYDNLMDSMLNVREAEYVKFHCLTPSWDNSPRRGQNATILVKSTPGQYGNWLGEISRRTQNKYTGDQRLLFVNAWNEWGEGNHLEPDQKWGRAYLEATARAIGIPRYTEPSKHATHFRQNHHHTKPKVSVVMTNWNDKANTLECLTSLSSINYSNFTVTVVDMGSTDDSVKLIRERFPNVKLLLGGEKPRPAGGNNLGIQQALADGCDYIFVLNNNTVVDAQVLQAFVDAASEFPDAGILCAKIYYYSQPKKIWYAGAVWSRHLSDLRRIGWGFVDNGNYFETLTETDYSCGGALLVRAETTRRIGFMDERFLRGYEVADWCCRAKRHGYKCVFVPGAKVWHKVSDGFRDDEGPLYEYYRVKNRLLWAKRNLPLQDQRLVWRHVLSEIYGNLLPNFDVSRSNRYSYFRNAYWQFQSSLKQWRDRVPMLKAELAGVRDYLLGRFAESR